MCLYWKYRSVCSCWYALGHNIKKSVITVLIEKMHYSSIYGQSTYFLSMIWSTIWAQNTIEPLIITQGQLSKINLRKFAIIFLSISSDMCFECLKEPSHRGGSFEHPQHRLWLKNKKIIFSFTLLSGDLIIVMLARAVILYTFMSVYCFSFLID